MNQKAKEEELTQMLCVAPALSISPNAQIICVGELLWNNFGEGKFFFLNCLMSVVTSLKEFQVFSQIIISKAFLNITFHTRLLFKPL